MQRTVFFVSDSTGITTETLGHSLLTQFPGLSFKQLRLPFITDEERARAAVAQINAASEADGAPALIFNTIVNDRLTGILQQSNAVFLDLFATFLGTMEETLGVKSTPTVGQAHGMANPKQYEARIEATNYALNHDDGVSLDFEDSDLVLVGVSRSGKTPTCLYLALHFGIKAANYPLTDDDLENLRLPPFLRGHTRKMVGLTIDPARLVQIREVRRPGSRYASRRQCHFEVETAENLMRMAGIPVFNTTDHSIEEIASRILQELDLQKEMY